MHMDESNIDQTPTVPCIMDMRSVTNTRKVISFGDFEDPGEEFRNSEAAKRAKGYMFPCMVPVRKKIIVKVA